MSNELNGRRQRLVTDGLSIDFFEAGDGHPVIVFPAKDADFSNPLLTKLAESRRVIFLNPSTSDFVAVSQLAQKLPHAFARMGIEQCSVIGISAGARPALALAIAAPKLIDRLILLSP